MIPLVFDQFLMPGNIAYFLNQYILNKTTNHMPLLNTTIIKLNEITMVIKIKISSHLMMNQPLNRLLEKLMKMEKHMMLMKLNHGLKMRGVGKIN